MKGDRYTDWDDYGDDHPVFNESGLLFKNKGLELFSVIAQLRITMSDDDLLFILNPDNFQNDTWMRSDMWFYNGNIKDKLTDVGIRVSG